MVSSPAAVVTSSAASNSAADETNGFLVESKRLEMEAFDRLPPYWRAFLQDRPSEGSAVQLTQKLRERGILPPNANP